METSLNHQLKIFNDQFSPEIIGALWVTDAELELKLKGFDEFNYLFDGLLSQYLFGEETKNSPKNTTNIFFTNNFNQHLFLIHLKNDSQLSTSLQKQMELIEKSNNNGRKTILVFNQTSSNLQINLETSYPQFIFKNLEF